MESWATMVILCGKQLELLVYLDVVFDQVVCISTHVNLPPAQDLPNIFEVSTTFVRLGDSINPLGDNPYSLEPSLLMLVMDFNYVNFLCFVE
jgi:hypothetical protein